ncbi:MAG: DUF1841 family protein [Burkholderiaceae bacterium]|jgi:hypothetical protein
MFAPTKEEVRHFFCDTWRKAHASEILTPLEAIARDWLLQHPEYENDFANPDASKSDYPIEQGQSNPFLHLSMHLSIAEQISIDQPRGIREAFLALARRRDSEHEAHHEIMECLGQMLWTAQRNGTPPDGEAYVECVKMRV